MHQPPVRLTSRLLSYLICVLLAGQPFLPTVAATLTPTGHTSTDKAANGVPVVNIATPNGTGISHNQFKDYNVGKEGLILNNATGKLNQTQLGGIIQNNPNLKAGKEAKGIINEVTGSNRSQLQGYTEVAGKAANVMVANPYGITCNGCGFINTPQATLTTGKPVFDASGNLQSLDVKKGSITIEGQGIDASNNDALAVISRATEVNAAIHAKDLKMIAGANRVNADGSVQAQQGEGIAPTVAVDTGALGGMYANRIHLVSSEKGVGVNLGDLNARQGNIILDTSGKLTVHNSLASGTFTARGEGLSLTGDHKASGNITLDSQGDMLLGNGSLNSDSDLKLSASGNISHVSEKLTAGRDVTLGARNISQNADSQVNAARNITAKASNTFNIQGQMTAGQNLIVSATTLAQNGELLAQQSVQLNAGTLNNRGTVQGDSLTVDSSSLSNSGSLLSGSRLIVNTQDFSQSGSSAAKGKAEITASGTLDNTGSLLSDDTLALRAQDVVQNGTLSGNKGLTVNAQTLNAGRHSVTHSGGHLTLNAQEVDLAGNTSAEGIVAVKGSSVKSTAASQLQGHDVAIDVLNAQLEGTQTASGAMSLSARDSLTHGGKTSADILTADSAILTNSGVMTADVLQFRTPQIVNSGLLKGERTLSLVATLLNNHQSGMIYSPSALSLSISNINNAGIITSDSVLSFTGTQLINSGELNGNTLALNVGLLRNITDGLILTRGENRITAASMTNAGSIAGNSLILKAERLDNSGLLQGDTLLSLTADVLNLLSGSRTLTNGKLEMSGITFTTAGQMQGETVELKARNWLHEGSLLATDTLTAKVVDSLASHGDIMSQGNAEMSASSLDNRGSLLSAADISLFGNALHNTGDIQGRVLDVHADTIANSGTLTGISGLTLASRIEAGAPLLTLTNSSTGALLTAGELMITAGDIVNEGQWQGKRVLFNAGMLTNSGVIQAQDSLTATLTGNLNGAAGSKITSNGSLALSALNLNNAGQWIANNLALRANTLVNSGDITGVDELGLTLNQQLDNLAGGKLLSAGRLTLNADAINNVGQIQGSATHLTGQTLSNSGRVQGETLNLNVSGEVNNATGGVLQSQDALDIVSQILTNRGTIQGGGESSLNVRTRAKNDGAILSGDRLTLTAPELINGTGGLVQALTLLLNIVNVTNSGRVLASDNAELKGGTINNDGMLQGAHLLLDYRNITNSGTALGTTLLTVKSETATNTASGKLFSAGHLALNTDTLNNAGQIVALADATLQLLRSLDNRGTLAAGNTLSLTSSGGITNNGTFQGNALVLSAGGALTNHGQFTAGNGNSTLRAQNILLGATGSFSAGGDVVLTSLSDITINGFTGTSGSLTMNTPGTLLNTALIYAANNMQLFADRIHNIYGDILADNSLWMQKNATGADSTEIINRSGTIETSSGDITLNTSHLLNEADGLTVSEYEQEYPDAVPQRGSYVNGTYTGSERPDFEISLEEWKHNGSNVVYQMYERCTGSGAGGSGQCSDRIRYRLEGEATRQYLLSESVVSVSATGSGSRIAAGRDITINAGVLDNRASQILAGRHATLAGDTLNNLSAEGGRRITYIQAKYRCEWFYDNCGSGDWRPLSGAGDNWYWWDDEQRQYRSWVPFVLGERETEFEADGGVYRSVISAGGNISTRFTNDISNTLVTANTGGFSNTITAPTLTSLSNQSVGSPGQVQSLVEANTQDITTPPWRDAVADALQNISGGHALDNATGTGADTSAYPLPSGDNGYFVPSADPESPYLIAVNPRLDGLGQLNPALFGDLYALTGIHPGEAPRETSSAYTDQKQFLGSSYFLDRLGLNPDKDYRFLGDAAFDTRYVSNTVLNQTGSRYINGIGSDLDQMRYLMDSAVAQQQALSLQFGVALTAAQVAALDKSLLWWESAIINGQVVMIPKVYLSPKDVTVHRGSVISGNNVQLAGGNVTNSGGTIVASNQLSIDSSNSLSNLNSGLISAGGLLDLSAMGNINNIGSAISGKTVQLESITGSINNITRAQRWNIDAGNVHIGGTDVGNTASITATDGLVLRAGQDINIAGANASAGGSLSMAAGNNISVTANELVATKDRWGHSSATTASNQASSITAGENVAMQAGNDLNVTASAINAGNAAQLVAGNDLNLSAGATSQTRRSGGSESHQSSADRTTVSAGDTVSLVAGRDLTSQAAGIAAEGNIGIRAGRDVNLLAEATTTGSSSHSSKKTVINESVRQQGTEIASGGNTTIIAGQDVNSQAAQVTAQGDIGVAAGRDVNLTTATESDYHYKEQTKTSGGFLSKKTTHTIQEDSATRQAGTLLSGDNVTVQAGNNLLVKGSSVVGDNAVSLEAGNNVDIIAATNTDSSWRFREEKKSGLMGTGGIGFTIGSSKSTHDLREAGTTQSQSFSTVGSTGGSVAISAGNQAHIGGADLLAGKDLSLSGSSVIIEPGHDKRTRDETFEQKKSGLTVALSGTVGSAINNAVSAAQDAHEASDGRLAALQATKSALSGVQAGQGVALDAARGDESGNNNTIGVSASLTTQKSKSEQHTKSDAVTGSTLSAGNNLSITASGKGNDPNSGDIVIAGSQLKAGGDTTLDAQNDILLTGAANTQQTSSKNSSSGGGVGVGIGAGSGSGSGGAGISVFASVNAAHGKDKGNGTDWTETTIDSGKTVTVKSGNDTILDGAQVNGNKIVADIGHDLLMSSQQDTNRYDSRQTSVAAGGSFTFGTMSGSGYINASQDKMKSRFDSVAEQTGLFAGDGGFDITVGNHTQLDGTVIASTATADKNSLDTGTLSFSDIHNEADFKTQHAGGSFNSGGSIAGQFASNAASTLLAGGGNKGHAEGTTQAAVADGTITIRDRASQKQDVADLSRDTEHANDSISPIFDKEKEQHRLKEIGLISEIGGQVADIARSQGELAGRKAAKDPASLEEARHQLAVEGKAVTEAAVEERAYNNASSFYGTGGAVQRGIQAATGALTVLAGGGDLAGALAGASAPELANIIGHRSGLSDDDALIAHALLGGVVASLQGKSAAAGAAGALTGELAGRAIQEQLYPGKKNSELSESDKQLVSNLATIASGLAGNIVSGNSSGTTAGAQAGKNAVENNFLGKALVEGCAIAAPCRTKVAEQLLEIGVKAGITGIVAKEIADKISAEELDHLITLKMTGNDDITSKYLGLLEGKYGPSNTDGDQIADSGPTNTGGNQLPALAPNHTGNNDGKTTVGPNHTGGEPSVIQLPNNTGNTEDAPDLPSYMENQGYDPRLPIPEATTASNGLKVESNSKHTPGAQGFRPNAGIEPKNSLDLFGNSVSIDGNKARYSMGDDGSIHRYFPDNTGTYHWSGSTGDSKNAMQLDNKTKAQLRKQEGWKIK